MPWARLAQMGPEPPPAALLVLIPALIVLSGVALFFLFVGRIWLRALLAGCFVGVSELIGMRLRGVSPGPVVDAWILAHKNQLAVGREQLEAHVLAGGDARQIVTALVVAKQGRVKLSFDQACAEQLCGKDVLAEVKQRVLGEGGHVEPTEEPRVQGLRAGGRCPYCHDEVEPASGAACVECMARHHEACWDDHGECAACGGRERYAKIERTGGREVRPKPDAK